MNGFDACTAPTLATMRVWRRQYAAVGVYIGGANYACAYGNLSAAWFKSAAAMGWGMLPTYVGPQAPCWAYSGTLIDPSKAAAEGQAAGADAVNDARLFGLAAGLADLLRHGGLQRRPELQRRGADVPRRVGPDGGRPGLPDRRVLKPGLGHRATCRPPPRPARPGSPGRTRSGSRSGTGQATLDDGTLDWPIGDRAKQYAGNIYGTVGGITLSIDQDVVAGPMAR